MVSKKRFKATPNKKKLNIHSSEQRSTDTQPPIFSLTHMANNKYGLNNCQQIEKAAFADKLFRLSQVKWVELQGSQKHGLGCEKIKQESIKTGIPSIITSDTNLIAFRFHGNAPMVGFRDGRIFHIIWLDRDYTLYDH